MRRLTIVLLALFTFVFAFSRLELLYGHKFYDATGRAQWISARHEMALGNPIVFFASREFDLPPQRVFTKIKIVGDPQYDLFFNGVEVGGRRVGEAIALDEYDVSKLARDTNNRMVVAVRSANGVSGLIASIDLAPEFLNYIVTGNDWNIVTEWSPDLLQRDSPSSVRPMLLGRPPARRWNYPSRQSGTFALPPSEVVQPNEAFSFKTALPDIQVAGGVAVTARRAVNATAYDFGIGTHGRVRLTLPAATAPRVVNVRFRNERSDLAVIEGDVVPFVFAAGETMVTDPQVREFRYVTVYGSNARADVLRQ